MLLEPDGRYAMRHSRAAGRRLALLGSLGALALALSACAPQAPAQPRTAPPASPTPTCSAEWCTVVNENFDRDAPLGSFEKIYGSDLAGYPETHKDTSGHGRYSAAKVLSVQDGMLDWWVHSEAGQPYTAAPLPQGYQGQKWGRWSMRFRSDHIDRFKMAMLLWSDSDRWSDGEIDFPEGELGQEIYGYSHNVEGKPSRNQFKFATKTDMTDWHTTEIEWTPEKLTFTLDGKLVKSTTDPKALPLVPLHSVMQVETSLEGPAPAAATEGHVQVDWIKIERYNPQAS